LKEYRSVKFGKELVLQARTFLEEERGGRMKAGSALNGDSAYCDVGRGEVAVMPDVDVVLHSQIYVKGFYERLAC